MEGKRMRLWGVAQFWVSNIDNISFYISNTIYLSHHLPLQFSLSKKDDCTYDTIFQTKNSNTLLMRVHISTQVNQAKPCPAPIMTLVGIQGTHPWLDERMMVVGYGPISSDLEFQKSKLLLAQVVNSVVQHFQLNPPENLRITDASLQRMQPGYTPSAYPSSGTSNGGGGTAQGRQNGGGPSASYHPPPPKKKDVSEIHFSEVVTIDAADRQKIQSMKDSYVIPSVPNFIPELDTVPKSEMFELLSDTEKLLPVIQENSIVTKTEEIKNSLLSSNQLTATSNLSKEGDLYNLHREVVDLQSGLKTKVEMFQQLMTRQQELCKPLSKDKVLKKLKKASKASMNESDDIAYNWLDNTTIDTVDQANVDAFVDEFLKKRMIHHVRAAKIERIENS